MNGYSALTIALAAPKTTSHVWISSRSKSVWGQIQTEQVALDEGRNPEM